ncbi:Ig-like domain-containing protein [Candidatus Palauibacter sp.]|uniref:Ig-like domain-containing protein n=1 Tax=Candidatus Palauibacter sp. TaxID=3101350 RepID=UPI003CC670F6
MAVTVHPVNDAPVAEDDAAETDEDTPVEIAVLANDTDKDGDELSVESATDPDHGTVTVNADGSITYTPDPDYFGEDTFEYTMTDGETTATAAVRVRTYGVNDPPIATGQISDMVLIVGGGPESVDAASFFRDVDGDPLKYGATSSDAGVASVSATGPALSVSAVSEGVTTIAVTASDEQASAAQTFSVTVRVDEQAEKQLGAERLGVAGAQHAHERDDGDRRTVLRVR